MMSFQAHLAMFLLVAESLPSALLHCYCPSLLVIEVVVPLSYCAHKCPCVSLNVCAHLWPCGVLNYKG